MSHEIIYQYRAFKIDGASAGDGQTRYVVAIEAGSSNCYDYGNRRSRSWQVLAVGTESEVMRRVVRIAGDCEGGMLKPGGKDCKPEQLIGKIRRMLHSDSDLDNSPGGWSPVIDGLNAMQADTATAHGARVDAYDSHRARHLQADFSACLPGYFRFVSSEMRNSAGWQLGKVYGLPNS